jgi:outer membrane lipoprotein SlyB
MKTTLTMAAALLAASSALSGCASPPQQTSQIYQPASQPATAYGVIDSIQVTQANTGSTGGTGSVVGGLVGGLLGNQIGSGSGRTAATVAGAIGGAVVGNQVEKNRNTQTRDMYQIGVRLENGGYQTILQDNIDNMRAGDRVRIQNDRVYRY